MTPREFVLAVIILVLNIVTTIVIKRIDQNPKPTAFSARTKQVVKAIFQRYTLLVMYALTFFVVMGSLFKFLENEGALVTRVDAFYISAATSTGIVWGIMTGRELTNVLAVRRAEKALRTPKG